MYLELAIAQRKGISMDVPKALSEWMRRLEDAQKTQVEPPRGLCAELRPYQRTGRSWLSALSDAGFGGILADDMGLGKTVQALALLLRERACGRPVRALVVCPASLQLDWRSEAARGARWAKVHQAKTAPAHDHEATAKPGHSSSSPK